jgi:hypothetical protein
MNTESNKGSRKIKSAMVSGRVFMVGQEVQEVGNEPGVVPARTGKIIGFTRSVNGENVIAKIRLLGSRTIIRGCLRDIEPVESKPV